MIETSDLDLDGMLLPEESDLPALPDDFGTDYGEPDQEPACDDPE